ncbi:F0F1 ATP synthase subunit A [Candidatus Gottesmanbacteria bacterium]|nr:F0F1 ATP synthase subunit A [Candidatus Gottesmanbacteria bacterium]
MPHISLAAETLWRVGGFPISNALLATWLVMAFIAIVSFVSTRKLTLVPGHAQSLAELLVGGLYDFFEGVIGKHVKEVFPLIASLFFFIIIANWVGLLPGLGTIGFFKQEHEVLKFVPLLRGATADLNTTLALALVSVVAIQYYGFRTLGFHYGGRFINIKNPIYFFVGILEILSDISKVISFAFRLFGNIFAGEVLLTVMAFLMPFIVPLPFLMLELFVGFIQALVFSMLTAVFLNVAVSHDGGEQSHESS